MKPGPNPDNIKVRFLDGPTRSECEIQWDNLTEVKD